MAHDCAHCALPLGRRRMTGTVDGETVAVCCFGCLLALQVTRARGEEGAAASIVIRLGLAVFFTMNVMMVSLPTYVPHVYGTEAGAVDGPLFVVLRVLAMVFSAPVLALLGWPILAAAARELRAGRASGDLLIMAGTLAAYALSVVHLLRGEGATYFDTAAMLLVLVTLGRWLEARARADAGAAIRTTLAPAPAGVLRLRAGGAEERVAADRLAPGDVVRVAAGDAIPVDGTVLAGQGGVDQSMLTGESAPVVVGPGARVHGGTCSVDGALTIRALATAADSAAARIERLVAAAARERSAAQRLADRVAAVLVPAVLAIAVAAGAWWTAVDGIDRGILVALAVLVVACPCALGIATPVAAWVGLATAARHGVVVRGGPVLERLAAVRHVVLDKTGTLTERVPALLGVEAAPGTTAADVLALAAALEAEVRHPLARGVGRAAAERGVRPPPARDVRAYPGRGVAGVVGPRRVAAGSAGFVAGWLGRPVPASDGAATTVVVADATGVLGRLRFAERLAPGAGEALAALRAHGVGLALLTGDTRADVAVPALLSSDEVAVELLPEDKVARVRAMRAAGRRPLAMVGDGINDAPAQAAADVGIAVGGASDLTRLRADVVVLGDDLRAVPWALHHAQRVLRVMRQNLAWAFGYNAVAVALAAAGALTPLVAALAMLASSAAVVLNARRLRHPAPAGVAAGAPRPDAVPWSAAPRAAAAG